MQITLSALPPQLRRRHRLFVKSPQKIYTVREHRMDLFVCYVKQPEWAFEPNDYRDCAISYDDVFPIYLDVYSCIVG